VAVRLGATDSVTTIDLGLVPFYWRTKPAPGPDGSGIPQRLPFAFAFDTGLQLVIQQRRPEVLNWLNVVYTRDTNVGYLQEGHSLAESYGNDFLHFFARTARPSSYGRGQSLAEIGCGGVYLLDRLRAQGYDVVGIDPSPVTVRAGARAGIRIIPEFFPSPSLHESFDVIIHYDVLEHTDDPVAFLGAHRNHLRPGGEVVLAVPDCTAHIAGGDIAMMLHEHLNYFDEASLGLTVRTAGFEPIAIERSSHGGVLFCHARLGGTSSPPPAGSTAKFDGFAKLVGGTRASISVIFESAHRRGEDIGCYVPLRAFPYLGPALDADIRVRLFDDDPGVHGRYFDGIDLPVENMHDLIARPPRNLIVFSQAFGDAICDRVAAATDGRTAIATIGRLTGGGD